MAFDAYLTVSFPDTATLTRRLSEGWREYLGPEAKRTNFPIGLTARPAVPHPLGKYLPSAYEAGDELPGADLERLRRDHLDAVGITRALVCHDAGRSLPALPNPGLSAELVRAANEWMADVVLASDPRLSGTLLLPTQSPTAAAELIEAAAADPRWAAVALSANSLGQPFGHPIYHPIHAAAAAAGLPIVIDAETDSTLDVLTNPTAGRASTYTDVYALASQPISTHLVSLIAQGVFERWPGLKVFVVGAGVTWITPMLWRFDTDFKAFRRDAPALSMLPSEYVHRNVRIGTYPLDRLQTPERLQDYLSVQPELEDVLCYASGFPAVDRDVPADLERWLPSAWLPKVLEGNARDTFRWPAVDAAVAGASA